MFYIILTILGILIYLGLPMPLQFVALFINTLIPDPIPYIDEIIMYGAFLKKIVKMSIIVDWVSNHKFILGIAGLIIFIIAVIVIL